MVDGWRDVVDDGSEEVENGWDQVSLSDLKFLVSRRDFLLNCLLQGLNESCVVCCRCDGFREGGFQSLEEESGLLLVNELRSRVRSKFGEAVLESEDRRRREGRHLGERRRRGRGRRVDVGGEEERREEGRAREIILRGSLSPTSTRAGTFFEQKMYGKLEFSIFPTPK